MPRPRDSRAKRILGWGRDVHESLERDRVAPRRGVSHGQPISNFRVGAIGDQPKRPIESSVMARQQEGSLPCSQPGAKAAAPPV